MEWYINDDPWKRKCGFLLSILPPTSDHAAPPPSSLQKSSFVRCRELSRIVGRLRGRRSNELSRFSRRTWYCRYNSKWLNRNSSYFFFFLSCGSMWIIKPRVYKNNVLISKARNFINYISKRKRDVWKKIGEIGKRLFFRVRKDVS